MYFLLLIVPTIILGLWAQWKVQHTYNKYKEIGSRGRITGREAAETVMRQAGIRDVQITRVPGHLTDHYDPRNKKLALSEENYHGTSLAALGVAAHEAGHAIQHKQQYAPLQARMALIPVTQFASQLLPIVILGWFFFPFMNNPLIIWGAVGIYAVLTVFQLVTLPVEFDASKRAKQQLAGLGIIDRDEMPGVSKTLSAAGWTYVAAFITSLAYLLYFLAIARR